MKGFKTGIIKVFFVHLAILVGAIGCSDNLVVKDVSDNIISSELGDGSSNPIESKKPPTEPGDEEQNKILFCSDLDLDNIKWPSKLSSLDINLYSLALNVTGSYEGFSNFQNITNNFDGQGMSLGIFQQNLGQGSLQPLLIKANKNDELMFTQYFTLTQRSSLQTMLNQWERSNDQNLSVLSSRKLASVEASFNQLDIESQFIANNDLTVFAKASNSVNAQSVDWAVKNLFENDGKTFKGNWKNNFKSFAGDIRYISLQLEAGQYLHDKAMSFMKQYDTYELRSYLFFFDLAVQNGGIQSSVRNNYLEFMKKNPNLSENKRLIALLEFRLDRVFERFREDVRSRKMTILTGVGTVHRTDRDLPEEYCVKDWSKKIR